VNDRFPILFKVGLVEPIEDFRKTDKALVGRTLVKTNKDIPLRLMNVSSQPKTLYELNFVTLDCDSVVAHVNFGMLTLQKVKPQYPIYVYISNHCIKSVTAGHTDSEWGISKSSRQNHY
jgi:hypothetical protein